jgi:thiamine kinase-like enzyme
LAVAFDKIKFVHNDLHLGNILLKSTTKKEISYAFSAGTSTSTHRTTTSKRNTQNRTRKQRNAHSNVRIQRYPVLGIQPIIMDFGKASCEQTNKDGHDVDNRDFWENILFLCQNIETLRKPKQYYIEWEWDDIKTYIRNAIRENMPCTAVVPLLRIIEQSTFRYVDTSRVKIPAYNPDIL